jgi:holo-[acyl-carrier protein] synthase
VIVGSGIDIVEIARVERTLARHGERFLERLLTPRERAQCERRQRPGPHLALCFAAKEAGMKAIGTGWRRGVRWRDFEVVGTESGLELRLAGRALEFARARGGEHVWLGGSFTRTHAVAHVVLEGEPGSVASG